MAKTCEQVLAMLWLPSRKSVKLQKWPIHQGPAHPLRCVAGLVPDYLDPDKNWNIQWQYSR